MTTIYNQSKMKSRRRELRKKQTQQEKIVWEFLRSEKFSGPKFRRQYSIGGFVLDFYCPKLKLAIEIDGSIHEIQKNYDKFRQSGIETLRIQFLRFSNDKIENEFSQVAKTILETICRLQDESLPHPAFGTPLLGKERGAGMR